MDEATYKKIKDWIFKHHVHHGLSESGAYFDDGEYVDMDYDTLCEDGDYPYVNSLSLEGFIDSLVDPTWAASWQYGNDNEYSN